MSLKLRYAISRKDLDHWIEVGYGALDEHNMWRVEHLHIRDRDLECQDTSCALTP